MKTQQLWMDEKLMRSFSPRRSLQIQKGKFEGRGNIPSEHRSVCNMKDIDSAHDILTQKEK